MVEIMKEIIYTEYTAIDIETDKFGVYEHSSKTGFTTFTDYIRIYTTVDNFIKLNPPCQTCLIQSMCVSERLAHPTLDSLPDHYLRIKICERLEEFVKNNKFFVRY